jgi:hypothetical protein
MLGEQATVPAPAFALERGDAASPLHNTERGIRRRPERSYIRHQVD